MAIKTSQATETALIKQELHQINSKLTSISTDLEKKYAQQTELALVRVAFSDAERRLHIRIDDLEKKAVTQDQHWPVRTLVFGYTALILVAVVSAFAALVIRSPV